MAKRSRTGSKSRNARRSRRSAPTVRVTSARKREVLGLLVMAIAVLILLAIVSYSREDDTLVALVPVGDLFDPSSAEANNALGLVGSHIAHALVPRFLGYPVAGLALLLFGWGYVFFRGRQPGRLWWISIIGTAAIFVLSTLFGWLSYLTETELSVWSGDVGLGLSAGMIHAFGLVGTIILLVFAASVLVLLGVDHDIQRSVDRLESGFGGLAARWRSYWAAWRSARAEAREQRREARRARRAALEASREESSRETRSAGKSEPAIEDDHRPEVHVEPVRRPVGESGPGETRAVTTINDLFRDRPERAEPEPPTPSRPASQPAPPAASPSGAEPPSDVAFSVHRPSEEKRAVLDGARSVRHASDLPYRFPSVDLLERDETPEKRVDDDELNQKKRLLLEKLDMHNIQLSNIEAIVGPTVTLFELKPAPGVKISQIKSLENDLAMALAARGIRMIAPIPGKSAVGLEIPNRHRELVRIRSVLETEKFRDHHMDLPVILGKTIQNEVYLADLGRMPHLLIAGATGSGKSVGLNCLIATLLFACHPSDLKFVMIDPKKIELQQYAFAQDHFIAMPRDADEPITTDFAHALGVLKSCIKEMERRYDLLSSAGVRGIKEYNQRLKEGRIESSEDHHHLPYIVVIIDELADLMMTAGKEIEGPIARLAQMARAVGLHLVVATQRPSVNVITGLIKANFPSRVAYQVASGVDSRTIIDQYGAEQLVGNGDLLFMSGSRIMRLQSPYISLDEVEAITQFVGSQRGSGPYLLPAADESSDPGSGAAGASAEETDDLFDEAARIVVRSQQGSVSLLQRKLSVGYTRAARIVDQLEDAGVVGPFEGSKARQVLIEDEVELDAFLRQRREPG